MKTFTDPLYTLVKGTDASLYRLVPYETVVLKDEKDVQDILRYCHRKGTHLTFKGGGTSLSGQTSTDGILAEVSPDFGRRRIRISPDGSEATFPCSIVGARANSMLHPYCRKIGPQPASIKAARIGGMVANNASGSSFGIAYNSYNTVRSMRIVLADGCILDTGSRESVEDFRKSHGKLCSQLVALRKRVLDDPQMAARIRHKYEVKNTCGYGVNSLVDFSDPVDILQHLMVGSEGTFGFISDVTFTTVPDLTEKACAMIYMPSLRDACEAVMPLRAVSSGFIADSAKGAGNAGGICSLSAAELMDRNALRVMQDLPGMPAVLKTLPDDAVALLVDVSATDRATLESAFPKIKAGLGGISKLFPVEFTTDPSEYEALWSVRNGLFTSSAASRPRGTITIIEDIAFRGEVLGDALYAIRRVLADHGYSDAVMWGHLMDGNVHFTIFPDMNAADSVPTYASFMEDLTSCTLKYDGSLKAEHGTGRNMATFVRKEWGNDIWTLMRDVKRTLDPEGILNPGVVINEDPEVFIKDLKHIPLVNDLIDKCIECGFCEVQCPAANHTMTPRQRIVAYRELASLSARAGTGHLSKEERKRFRKIKKAFRYAGEETCATDGLCGTACPVGINTGLLIKELRWKENSSNANRIATKIARNMDRVTSFVRGALNFADAMAHIISYPVMEGICRFLFLVSNHHFPLWTRYVPRGARKLGFVSDTPAAGQPEMVYFPSCITRSLGVTGYGTSRKELQETSETIALLHKAGFAIRYPEGVDSLCCGMAFYSKGFREQAAEKSAELEKALLAASDGGRLPILFDMSPCLLHARETLDPVLKIYEPVEFIYYFMLDKLKFRKIHATVALHSTCSTTKIGATGKLREIGSLCADKVVMPEDVTCCAWAGDRGFFFPENNVSALRNVRPVRDPASGRMVRNPSLCGATSGYSNSRTCEIGLSRFTGIPYRSIVYLVNSCTGSIRSGDD
ncbi:MAG: FAD-binding oxidoreductase [Bacteroidales bacterium]|jgi:D-lactate dehydrogenase|nr:FAD-binding oxidoreductase [Bacteroidales bacterium]MCI2146239.1 FAD-binding oxidoreductase [Bacteroidales bacterium]